MLSLYSRLGTHVCAVVCRLLVPCLLPWTELFANAGHRALWTAPLFVCRLVDHSMLVLAASFPSTASPKAIQSSAPLIGRVVNENAAQPDSGPISTCLKGLYKSRPFRARKTSKVQRSSTFSYGRGDCKSLKVVPTTWFREISAIHCSDLISSCPWSQSCFFRFDMVGHPFGIPCSVGFLLHV